MVPQDRYVSITDIVSFKACRERWNFGSPLRSNRQPKLVSKHLRLGAGVHTALEAYYSPSGRTPDVLLGTFKSWADEETAQIPRNETTETRMLELMDMIDLGTGMLQHYASWAPLHDDFDVIEPEVSFRIPLPFYPGQHVYFVGRADGWVKRQGEYYLLEWKTAKGYPPLNALFLDEQCIAYQWGAQVSPKFDGRRPKGTIYTFLLKSLPEVPRQLQTGGLSKSMATKTTAEIYERELRRLGLPNTLYGDVLQALKEKPNPFFLRATIQRTDKSLFRFGTSVVAIVREMLDPMVPIYPTPNWYVCPRCAFVVPCTMVCNGVDPTPILEADYTVAEPRYEFGEEEPGE